MPPNEIPTNGELMRQILSLTRQVEEGFRNVNSMQRDVVIAERINTEFRLKAEGSLSTFKWLFGLLGVGNIAIIIKLFLLY